MTYTDSMKPIVEKFAAENLVYTQECWDYITTADLYDIFKKLCAKTHCHNTSITVFIRNMKTIPGPVHERQREPNKRNPNAVSMFRYTKVRETQ